MDPKKMLAKELAAKVGSHISGQTVSEMVDNFVKYGNMFLLLELVNLRKEVESLREELHQRKNKRSSLRPLLVP
jgi:polyhydroxyalkanoate synthesis regulator phasin